MKFYISSTDSNNEKTVQVFTDPKVAFMIAAKYGFKPLLERGDAIYYLADGKEENIEKAESKLVELEAFGEFLG